jgi:hypothetical protein
MDGQTGAGPSSIQVLQSQTARMIPIDAQTLLTTQKSSILAEKELITNGYN